MNGKRLNKNKKEWSKIICGVIVFYGLLNGVLYHVEMFMVIASNNPVGIVPDPSLAVQSIITIIGAFLSYLLYQFGLKNSRNKYGVDSEGSPYKRTEIDYSEENIPIDMQNMEDV